MGHEQQWNVNERRDGEEGAKQIKVQERSQTP